MDEKGTLMREPRADIRATISGMEPETRAAAIAETRPRSADALREPPEEPVFRLRDVGLWYGSKHAIGGITFNIPVNRVTALIGPSGCGKSTLLRCLNRMNDLIPSARTEGTIEYHGVDIYDKSIDPVEVRRRVGIQPYERSYLGLALPAGAALLLAFGAHAALADRPWWLSLAATAFAGLVAYVLLLPVVLPAEERAVIRKRLRSA